MKSYDLKKILAHSQGRVTEEDIQDVRDTIHEVEKLGARRSYYNVAPPFARQGSTSGQKERSPIGQQWSSGKSKLGNT